MARNTLEFVMQIEKLPEWFGRGRGGYVIPNMI